MLGKVGQRLPDDHLGIRAVLPAPGMSPDRGRPTRPAVIDRFRVPVWSAAPTGAGGSSDAAVRRIRTHVLGSCLSQVFRA
jgi:hypothetical protein